MENPSLPWNVHVVDTLIFILILTHVILLFRFTLEIYAAHLKPNGIVLNRIDNSITRVLFWFMQHELIMRMK